MVPMDLHPCNLIQGQIYNLGNLCFFCFAKIPMQGLLVRKFGVLQTPYLRGWTWRIIQAYQNHRIFVCQLIHSAIVAVSKRLKLHPNCASAKRQNKKQKLCNATINTFWLIRNFKPTFRCTKIAKMCVCVSKIRKPTSTPPKHAAPTGKWFILVQQKPTKKRTQPEIWGPSLVRREPRYGQMPLEHVYRKGCQSLCLQAIACWGSLVVTAGRRLEVGKGFQGGSLGWIFPL